ncbi:RICIN domain-containing protein [Streptomyces sp. NPDC096057]|uniref:RICIN domain-containing protein n=1 Tax=Streptomyces sp. NPDC096057 TaxID=3155543 RepID=UPI0033165E53
MGGEAESAGAVRRPETAGGTPLPRLSQLSSLGSRPGAARGAGAESSAGGSAGTKPGDGFAGRTGTGRQPSPTVVVPLAPAARTGADTSRREGFRGALAVVSIVGLLSAGSVLLTLNLTGGHNSTRGANSASAESAGHDTDAVDGLGVVPEASRSSGTAAGETPDGSAKPTSGSPGADASGKASASPGKDATATAKSTTRATGQAAAPGVNVYSHASQRCIGVVGGKAAQGAKLMIWDCAQTAAQHWTFTGGTMRALGMCVQLAGGSTEDGADIELGACNGSSAQRFALNVRHDLVHTPTGKCTDVRDNGMANGTRLQLWSCSGGDNQKWSAS